MQNDDRQTVVSFNGQELIIPKSWNDLDQRILMICYQIVMDMRIKNIFPDGEGMFFRRLELAKAVLGWDDGFLESWKADAGEEDFFAELQQVVEVASIFAFTEVEDGAFQLNLGLTKCPFPELVHKEHVYYAPADELENITLFEMGMAFRSFEQFVQTGDTALASQLIAILYRPGKMDTAENLQSDYQGDRRLPLYKHETTIKKRQNLMADLPALVSQLIVFWFASCRQTIIDGFPNIFKSDGAQKEGNDYSWAGVILNLSEGLANEETVSNKNHYTALVYLSMLEDRRKEQEIKQQLARRK